MSEQALSRRTFIRFGAIAALSVSGIAVSGVAGCTQGGSVAPGSSDPSGTSAAGTAEADDKVLYVGTQNDYPPFTFVDSDNELNGFDIEFVRILDERLDGHRIEIQPLGWDSSFLAIDSGRIDMIVDQVAINAEREESYLFSEPYFTAQSVIIVKTGTKGISSLDDLVGKTVGTTAGDSYSMLLEAFNAAHGPDNQIKLVYWNTATTAESLQNLEKGAVDAFVNDPVMARAVIKELGLGLEIVGKPLLTDPIGVLFPKNERGQKLKELLDPIIIALIEDGTLKELSVRWTEDDYIPRR